MIAIVFPVGPVIFRTSSAALLLFSLAATPVIAAADAAQALVGTGKKLVAEAKCDTCHASKLGGDGNAMYLRADRRVTSKSGLLAQVARCNNELSLGLFPDDEAAIAAYLNATYYKLAK